MIITLPRLCQLTRHPAYLSLLPALLFLLPWNVRAQSGNTPVYYSVNNNYPTGNSNFQTFTEAFEFLKAGISSPVVIYPNYGTGPYNEKLIIGAIPGASATNNILVYGNEVTITYNVAQADQAVIKLDGADHIKFDHLRVNTGNSNYGSGFMLTNGADSNIIVNCIVKLSTSSDNYDNTGIGIFNSRGNSINNNNVTGGNFGVYLTSTANKLRDNVISDFYEFGVYVNNTTAVAVTGNHISRPTRSIVADFNGIYLTGLARNDTISGNFIHSAFSGNTASTKAAYGIFLANTNTPAGASLLVSNNAVSNLNGSGAATGIRVLGAANTQVYHNSVSIDGTALGTATELKGIQFENCSAVVFKNNLVNITRESGGKKYGIYGDVGLSSVTIDYNNYYLKPGMLNSFAAGHNGRDYPGLLPWQMETSQDRHSLTVDPQLSSPASGVLSPQAMALDNKGVNVGVASDIYLQTRSTSTPDIGAFEFTGATCMVSPGAATTSTTNVRFGCTFDVSLTGHSVSTSQTYQWQVAQNVNGPYTSFRDVSNAPFTTVVYNFSNDLVYIRAAVMCGTNVQYSSPVSIIKNLSGISGTYTINPSAPVSDSNFHTFTAAVAAVKCGVSGPVTFNVAPGTYDEQIILKDIPSTPTNRITFQSADDNPASVNLKFFTRNGPNYRVVTLGSNITLRSMTITADNPYVPFTTPYGIGIALENSSNDSIINCIISVPGTFNETARENAAGIVGEISTDNVFMNNRINGGNYGIYFTSGGRSNSFFSNICTGKLAGVQLVGTDIKFIGNNVQAYSEQGSTVVSLECSGSADISNNIINGGIAPNRSVRGLVVSSNTSVSIPARITNNTVYMLGSTNSAGVGSTAMIVTGNNAHITNNVVLLGTSLGYHTGLYCSGQQMFAYNNTVLARPNFGNDNTNSAVVAAEFGGNVVVRNNIFSTIGRGTAMAIGGSVNSDYNLLYASGGELVRSGLNYSTLQAWRNASGHDRNSVSLAPAFINNSTFNADLRPDSSSPEVWALQGHGIHIAGNDKDINGNPRPTTLAEGAPDLGAYEFTPVVAPPAATAIPATPIAGSTQTFVFAADTIATIHWAPDAPVPTSLEVRRYSGMLPPSLPAGSEHMYFYDSIKAEGPRGYKYDIDLNYKKTWLGTIQNEAGLKLGKGTAAGNWNPLANSTVNTNSNTLSAQGLDGFSLFTGLSNPAAITFSGKVLLQGAFNPGAGLMNNGLNTAGILKTHASNQPYGTANFGYSGNESVGSTFFESHTDIVDWVLMELRSSSSPGTVAAARAAFVKRNGTLVDVDGTGQVSFAGVAPADYFVSIRHRNHLAVRSALTIDFSSGAATHDFTTGADKAYQSQAYSSMVQVGAVWAMRAGDANANGNIRYSGPQNDQNQILNIKLGGSLANIVSGVYAPEDINMDGSIKYNGPANDQNFLLNIIFSGLLSTMYTQQL
ncbi:hypothetical protein EXU57_17165 [Segetibacter sp. 3557_3]|uniref:right-handed parallel beta-helix repeat-containing protein n=1 Tax=Segetibacter sp. 3557_3 TaxID=2547429 RepID=UPI001058737B|nr:right-handed parallel beta-helix repeat-containing protein [Segetibacter sp. 3557_3]TDH23531.1 hypothetical protein EXU57_17165 [Segetibacter sp. 3557_3]